MRKCWLSKRINVEEFEELGGRRSEKVFKILRTMLLFNCQGSLPTPLAGAYSLVKVTNNSECESTSYLLRTATPVTCPVWFSSHYV